jgi:hypothetical protein
MKQTAHEEGIAETKSMSRKVTFVNNINNEVIVIAFIPFSFTINVIRR